MSYHVGVSNIFEVLGDEMDDTPKVVKAAPKTEPKKQEPKKQEAKKEEPKKPNTQQRNQQQKAGGNTGNGSPHTLPPR